MSRGWRFGALTICALCACASSGAPPASEAELPRVALQPETTLRSEGGLLLEQQPWTHGDVHGVAWRASVSLPGHPAISPSDGVVEFAALTPSDDGPWAAINGGFYDPSGKAMGLVVSGGVQRSALVRGGGSGVFLVGPVGPRVIHRDAWEQGPQEALQSIDRLIDDGKVLVKKRDGPLAARSAVAIGRGRLWLIALAEDDSVVALPDGARLRHTAGHGLSLGDFADYVLRTTGAAEALNLDGAVSTQLAVRTHEGVYRVRGELGTINAVVIRP